jgi:vitellogenic carboxypeptidase-like protein
MADAQDGVAHNSAWVATLQWSDWDGNQFNRQQPRLLTLKGSAVGWQRNVSALTQVAIRNAGHMVPQDQPLVARMMIEEWVQQALAYSQQG